MILLHSTTFNKLVTNSSKIWHSKHWQLEYCLHMNCQLLYDRSVVYFIYPGLIMISLHYGRNHDLVNRQYWCVYNSVLFLFRHFFQTRVTLVEQELLTLPDQRSSLTRSCCSIFLLQYFVDHCLPFFLISFGNCIICPSICDYWLVVPLWYLQVFIFN